MTGIGALDNSIRNAASRAARRRLLAVRLLWFVLASLVLLLTVAAVPPSYHALRQVCRLPLEHCAPLNLLTAAGAASLAVSGVSLHTYALSMLALELLSKAVWIAVGVIIFLRRSDDWLAILVSLWLITFGPVTFSSTGLDLLALAHPTFNFPVRVAAYSGEILTIAFFLLFPGGNVVPGWARWPALFLAVYHLFAYFFPTALSSWLGEAGIFNTAFFIGMVGFLVYSQIYRYRFVSTTTQRYQTRWIVAATVFAIGGLILTWLAIYFLLGNIGLTFVLGHILTTLLMLLIPLSVAVAVLRYRLFDITLIIRRTAIYAVLTTALGLLYFGSVIALQAVSHIITGQESELTIVLSTLLIAALFTPLRRAVQRWIDLRFYRRRYDAQERLQSFAAVARDEVDLEKVTAALLGVVEETLRPTSVALWLKK